MINQNQPIPQGDAESGSFFWWLPLAIFATVWWLIPALIPQLPVWISGDKAAWYLSRASGTVGYLTITASTVWGLLLSTKVIKELVPAPVSLALHEWLSWTGIGLSLFHGFVLLYDTYYTYRIADILIPFMGPYQPLWVGVGTLAMYIMLLTSATFYLRSWVGHKNWRKLHYLTFVAFAFATVHGWMAGTDATQLGLMYTISGFSVIFLTIYRILDAISKPHRKRTRTT